MRKFFTLLITVLFTVSFASCSKDEPAETVEIDTGIPDVVMMIDGNLTKNEYAHISDDRVQYINDDEEWVEYRIWDSDGNIEMEKYRSYHEDGRLYQELIKLYDNGELWFTDLSQYEYTKGSKEAVVTIWEYNHTLDKLESDSVVCTMTTAESDVYCNSRQSGGLPLKIRGVCEYRYGMHLSEIEFIAGTQIDN